MPDIEDKTAENADWTPEDQEKLNALEKEVEEQPPDPSEDKKPSEEKEEETKEEEDPKKPPGEEKPEEEPEPEAELYLGKYKGTEALEKAFLANQGETTRMIQSHQSEITTRDKRIADLEAEKASPKPPEEEPEEIPDPEEDMEGYMAAQRRLGVKEAEEAAERRFNDLMAERDGKAATVKAEKEAEDAKILATKQEQARYTDQALSYKDAYYPDTEVADIPSFVKELTKWYDYGKSVDIDNPKTAREHFEGKDPERIKAAEEKAKAKQLKDLKERQARWHKSGEQVISGKSPSSDDIAHTSYERLGEIGKKGVTG